MEVFDRVLAYLDLADLADNGHRELVDDPQLARDLELGDAARAEELFDLACQVSCRDRRKREEVRVTRTRASISLPITPDMGYRTGELITNNSCYVSED